MTKIVLLDQNTINKIAAGEVVERPASVVKELVENSIDAKATAITVEIKEGGLSMLRITDNGIGIEPGDIQSAFLRHSTSKIKSIEDLLTVSSLGFRGEALASIASVSQVELITKTYDQLTGIRFVIEGGTEKIQEQIGCPVGTTLIINNIFFNTPARRKFLKSPMTEAAYIFELMNKLALGNPHISFKFINNGQVKLHTSGNNKLEGCIFTVFGKDIAKNLIAMEMTEHEVFGIKGFIGKPLISRANRSYENYYINGRYIKSKVIQKAIEDAYKTKLTLHQYPFCVFNLIIASDYIDVNVHPTKMDIRFNNEQQVYDVIYNAVFHALHKVELIPELAFEDAKKQKLFISQNVPEPFEKKRIEALQQQSYQNFEKEDELKDTEMLHEVTDTLLDYKTNTVEPVAKPYTDPQPNTIKTLETPYSDKALKGDQIDYKASLFINQANQKEHKIIGQLFSTYWIIEFKDKYYIMDQHAAHERVLYEKILKGLKEKVSFSQALMQPIVVQLSMKEKLRFETHQTLFEALGFEIEDFGGEALTIRAVPYIFEKPINPSDFIYILDRLDDEYKAEKYDILLDEIASMSCKAAVKAHDHMALMEYHELIDQLLLLDNPFNCPHGRPTLISMTKYELEKKFKRIV